MATAEERRIDAGLHAVRTFRRRASLFPESSFCIGAGAAAAGAMLAGAAGAMLSGVRASPGCRCIESAIYTRRSVWGVNQLTLYAVHGLTGAGTPAALDTTQRWPRISPVGPLTLSPPMRTVTSRTERTSRARRAHPLARVLGAVRDAFRGPLDPALTVGAARLVERAHLGGEGEATAGREAACGAWVAATRGAA